MTTERELAEVLAPCPCCGSADVLAESYILEAAAWCRDCRLSVKRSHGARDELGLPQAIAAWNRRPALLSRADGGEATLVARKHRGSLSDSMETAKSIPATESALRDFFEAPDGTLEVSPYGWDQRIGWDTHIVTIDGAAIGFTNAAMAKERGEPAA